MKKTLITSAVIVSIVSSLYAGGSHSKTRHSSTRTDCSTDLGLTVAQMSEIQAYRDEFKTNLDALETTDPMLAAIEAGDFDTDAYIAAATSDFDARIELEADYLSYAYSVLTDDQKTVYAEALADGTTCGDLRLLIK